MENMSSIDNEDIENTEINAASYEIQLWDQLEINPNLLRGIFAYGFEKPSPIQQKAIKPIILGKDVIVQAQSGTGKTATFTIGALSRLLSATPIVIRLHLVTSSSYFSPT